MATESSQQSSPASTPVSSRSYDELWREAQAAISMHPLDSQDREDFQRRLHSLSAGSNNVMAALKEIADDAKQQMLNNFGLGKQFEGKVGGYPKVKHK